LETGQKQEIVAESLRPDTTLTKAARREQRQGDGEHDAGTGALHPA
jgi:hypothetical protein